MEQKEEMNLQTNGNSVIFKKDGKNFSVWQGTDRDVWFDTNEDNLVFEIDFRNRNIEEYASYEVFANLMRKIVGNYILEDESVMYGNLPEDFIDLKNKSIIWHSDNGMDNILKMQYENQKIILSIIKSNKSRSNDVNRVRIRTSGSSYGYYYQYFVDFYKELVNLVYELNPPKTEINNNKTPKEKQLEKKFSIFKKGK